MSLNNYVEGNYFNVIPRQVLCIQKGFVRSLRIIQILTGGGES